MWLSIPSGNMAPKFHPLLYALFAIKTCDYRQDFNFYHKTKCKVADKTSVGAMFPEGTEGYMKKIQ